MRDDTFVIFLTLPSRSNHPRGRGGRAREAGQSAFFSGTSARCLIGGLTAGTTTAQEEGEGSDDDDERAAKEDGMGED